MRWRVSGRGCLLIALGLGLGLGCGRSTRARHDGDSTTGGAAEPGGAASDGGGTGAAGGTPSHGASAGANPGAGGAGSAGGGIGDAGVSASGSSGSAGGSSGAGRGGAGGSAGATTSCVTHMGPIVDPQMGASLGGVDLGQKFEPGCRWTLGEPVALPADDDTPRLVLHYDVNGDEVDDLFFGRSTQHAPISSLRLLLSKPYSRDLAFEDAGCEIPLAIEYRSIVVRDIDGDGVPDWVVGTPTGIKLLHNERGGLREVGGHDFGATVASVAMMDVAVARFGPTDAEVAVGYDLYQDDVVTGVVLFRQVATGEDLAYESEVLTSSALSAPDSGPRESGYVTTVSLNAAPAIVGLGWGAPDALGWLWDGAELRSVEASSAVEGQVNFVSPLVTGSSSALAVGFPASVGMFELSSAASAPVLLDSIPTYFELDGLGREPGGGIRRTSRLVRDLDRDGNDDLVELGQDEAAEGQSLVVSLQRSGGWERSDPVPLHGYLGAAGTEDPFLHVSTVPARVLIRDAGEIDDGPAAPALQSFKCEMP